MRRSRILVLVVAVVALAACGDSDDGAGIDPDATTTTAAAEAETDDDVAEQRFPDVVDAELTPADDDTFRVSVTLSSPYDTPERYADAWRVIGGDGTVYGVRELTHDHANEQPFTRSLDGVEIPPDVTEVVLEGRDQTYGWGGTTLTVAVPAAG